MIYFFRSEKTGLVKIGKTTSVVKRISQIREKGDHITAIRLYDGPPWVEFWFHKHFKENRVRGEWFTYHPDMMTVLPPDERPEKESGLERRVREGIISRLQLKISRDASTWLRLVASVERRSISGQVEWFLIEAKALAAAKSAGVEP